MNGQFSETQLAAFNDAALLVYFLDTGVDLTSQVIAAKQRAKAARKDAWRAYQRQRTQKAGLAKANARRQAQAQA